MRIWISSWKIKKEQEGPTSVCMYVGKVVGFQQNIIDKYLALEKRHKNYTELWVYFYLRYQSVKQIFGD